MFRGRHPVLLNKWIAERRCQTTIAAFLFHLFYNELMEKPILVLAKHREFPGWLYLFEQYCPGMYAVNLTGLHESRNVIK